MIKSLLTVLSRRPLKLIFSMLYWSLFAHLSFSLSLLTFWHRFSLHCRVNRVQFKHFLVICRTVIKFILLYALASWESYHRIFMCLEKCSEYFTSTPLQKNFPLGVWRDGEILPVIFPSYSRFSFCVFRYLFELVWWSCVFPTTEIFDYKSWVLYTILVLFLF